MIRTVLIIMLASCISDDDGSVLTGTGGACETGDDCEGGVCLEELDDHTIEFKDGMCSAECDGVTGVGCLVSSEVCLEYIATAQSNCYKSCVFGVEGECRDDGYRCTSVGFLTWACMPPTPSMP